MMKNMYNKMIFSFFFIVCVTQTISNDINISKSDEHIENKNKTGFFTKFANKIDNRVNPEREIYIPDMYGTWYVSYTTSQNESSLDSLQYTFEKQGMGFTLKKSYYDLNSNVWKDEISRAWIDEEHKIPYIRINKKYYKSYKNKIAYIDENYKNMAVIFEGDNNTRVIKVFSKNIVDNITETELKQLINYINEHEKKNKFINTNFYKVNQSIKRELEVINKKK